MNIGRLGVLAALTLVPVGCKPTRQPKGSEPKPLRQPAADKMTLPALAAGDDDGLTFAIETTPTTDPAGRRLRLLLGGGDATLTLNDPASKSAHATFGGGVLQATDRAHGAPLVAAVARWLGQKAPTPPDTPGPLRPFQITYARLGHDAGWECIKLFLQNGSQEAEVFLNVRLDGKQARLVEKDEDYRQSLLALLATAVRDGKAPRRTSGGDLGGPTPLVASLAPIAGSHDERQPQAWVGGAWIAAREGDATQKLMYWGDLKKEPHLLAEVTGSVPRLAPSPKRDRVALLVLHPKEPGSLSSDDPGDVMVASIGGDPVHPVAVSAGDFRIDMLSHIVWSPDGTAIAIDGRAPGAKVRTTLTRVYEAASGHLLAGTAAVDALDLVPLRWDGDTLVLDKWTKTGRQAWRWRPGNGVPKPDRTAPAVSLRSPDGRYTLRLRGTTVEITGPGGRRSFQPRSEGDRAAVEALREDPDDASWLGGGTLVLMSETPMALDLATGKLRYVFPDDDLQFMSASDDGTTVVARDGEQRLLWGRVAR